MYPNTNNYMVGGYGQMGSQIGSQLSGQMPGQLPGQMSELPPSSYYDYNTQSHPHPSSYDYYPDPNLSYDKYYMRDDAKLYNDPMGLPLGSAPGSGMGGANLSGSISGSMSGSMVGAMTGSLNNGMNSGMNSGMSNAMNSGMNTGMNTSMNSGNLGVLSGLGMGPQPGSLYGASMNSHLAPGMGAPMQTNPNLNVIQKISLLIKSQLPYLQTIMMNAKVAKREERNRSSRQRSRAKDKQKDRRDGKRRRRSRSRSPNDQIDWLCTKCSFSNYHFREKCNRCNEAKPQKGAFFPGPTDWRCGKCQNINYARRTECNRCKASRQK